MGFFDLFRREQEVPPELIARPTPPTPPTAPVLPPFAVTPAAPLPSPPEPPKPGKPAPTPAPEAPPTDFAPVVASLDKLRAAVEDLARQVEALRLENVSSSRL